MQALQNNTYLFLYIVSNIISLLMLLAAWKYHHIARIMFCLLFAWASWTNWNEAVIAPQFYIDYAGMAFSNVYRQFILGWFSFHIALVVGFIASCQALIAVSMLLRGWIFKAGATGSIIFLIAIAPLGLGAAFPCTLILAAAMWLLLRKKGIDYLWVAHSRKKLQYQS